MVAGYDSWLLRQADEYMSDCEPEIIKAEWHNKWCQGHPRHDTDNICFECPVENCEVRIIHVLDSDWLPYIQSINERFKQCGKQ